MLKAIETVYKGYKFRSRLEARWAVFFDAMGIAWDYEKEGFELYGQRYLPDFWLPHFNMWAEVKPKELTKQEYELCKKLVVAAGNHCLLLVGIPDFREYTLLEPYNGNVRTDSIALISEWFNEHRFGSQMNYDDPDLYGHDYNAAILAARQARFEFGEKPDIEAKRIAEFQKSAKTWLDQIKQEMTIDEHAEIESRIAQEQIDESIVELDKQKDGMRAQERALKLEQLELYEQAKKAVESGNAKLARQLGELGHQKAIEINLLQKKMWPELVQQMAKRKN